MTQANKLERLISKAIEGGWETPTMAPIEQCLVRTGYIEVLLRGGAYYFVLFNHDFAKALWGDGDVPTDMDYYKGKAEVGFYDFGGKLYLYHLICAVVASDPIDYMYEVVFGKQ